MAEDSPYKIFSDWLFDGNTKSEIPNKSVLLKYSSPINHTYVLKLFMKNPTLNFYLNWQFNNINLRYLTKEEFFIFIKKCVRDFNIKRNSMMFFPYQKKHELFDKLQEKLPMMKKDDILLICEEIEKNEDKDLIYSSMGIDKVKTEKVSKKNRQMEINKDKVSLKSFIENNFNLLKI